jgi:hypothetical protein
LHIGARIDEGQICLGAHVTARFAFTPTVIQLLALAPPSILNISIIDQNIL